MSNLVPVKRPDKNGKLAIRWVRPEDTTTPAVVFPAPASVLSQRAESDTLDDLDDLLVEFGANKWSRTQPLRQNVSRMSAEQSQYLIQEFHGNPAVYAEIASVSRLLDEIYGDDSAVPVQTRDTVMRNFMDITPGYDITGDSENDCIIEATRAVHKAVGGFNRDTPYTEDEKPVLQSASFIVMRIKQDKLIHEMSGTGISHVDDYIELDDIESIEELSKHVEQLEILRERVADSGVFTADMIHKIADAGVLWEGAL